MITGEDMEIEAGPNWDDDLSGSPIYAANDPNLGVLNEEEKRRFFELQQLVYFYLPRMCNHCLNPSCVAACPSGAIYKRGEDGIVLVSQEKCQGWRMCVSGCPYKKVYFNWNSGKAEKCILCYPRLEMGEAPACMHSCVGKIRYLGVLLYDADRIEEIASRPESELVEAQRDMILDPFDPEVIREAANSGIDRKIVESAQKSPIFKFVKQWRMALPLHPEWRTLPMLFYVPPLLPVTATLNQQGCYEMETDFFSSLENARLPIRYMASLFSAGDESEVIAVYRKLLGVRIYKRAQTVGDISMETAQRALEEAHLTPEEVEGIFYLTALAGFDERLVVPPFMREQVVELGIDTQAFQEQRGAGFLYWPTRGL
jgi:nitrate reductase beta subunit